MTRARALKAVIRARAAKTGERYTTARRHVLNDLRTPEADIRLPAASAPAPAKAKSASPPARSKGGVSDATSREKTGHGVDHWFDVLDRFGGVEKGHTASARHLYDAHGVPGWYAQGITVAYERARGVRAVNQRCDGEYEVSVSKVVAGKTADVIKALTDKRVRTRWVKGVDAPLRTANSPTARWWSNGVPCGERRSTPWRNCCRDRRRPSERGPLLQLEHVRPGVLPLQTARRGRRSARLLDDDRSGPHAGPL